MNVRRRQTLITALKKPIFSFEIPCYLTGLSLIFQVDGELKKVAGGQKKSGAAAELAGRGGVGGYSGGLGFEKITLANIGVTKKRR